MANTNSNKNKAHLEESYLRLNDSNDNNLLSIDCVINTFPELCQVACNASNICNVKCGKDDSVTL